MKWLIPFNTEIVPEMELHRKPWTFQLYSNQPQLFMDFPISSKILKNNPINDLRAMQTQSKIWADFLNKYVGTGEYENT